MFIKVRTDKQDYGVVIDDGGGDFSQSLYEAGIAWSEIDYTLYSHLHFDHFNPVYSSVHRLAKFFWLDEKVRKTNLNIYGKNHVIERYKNICEEINAPVTKMKNGKGYIVDNREGEDKIFLNKIEENKTYHLKPFLSIIPIKANHSSYCYWGGPRGTAVGYILSIFQNEEYKSIVFYSDVGSVDGQTERFIIEYGKKNPYKLVIKSIPVPFGSSSDTQHLDIHGTAAFYKKLVDEKATDKYNILYLTHLSPRWKSAKTNIDVSRVMKKLGIWDNYQLASDGEELFWLNEAVVRQD
jgi:predicted metallo-beta-lactamase superfamily hydrolase